MTPTEDGSPSLCGLLAGGASRGTVRCFPFATAASAAVAAAAAAAAAAGDKAVDVTGRLSPRCPDLPKVGSPTPPWGRLLPLPVSLGWRCGEEAERGFSSAGRLFDFPEAASAGPPGCSSSVGSSSMSAAPSSAPSASALSSSSQQSHLLRSRLDLVSAFGALDPAVSGLVSGSKLGAVDRAGCLSWGKPEPVAAEVVLVGEILDPDVAPGLLSACPLVPVGAGLFSGCMLDPVGGGRLDGTKPGPKGAGRLSSGMPLLEAG